MAIIGKKEIFAFVLASLFLIPVSLAQTCTDSDTTDFPTIDYSVQGTVTNWGGSPLTDRCETAKTLMEYYCNAGGANSQTYNCPEACSDGACVMKEQQSFSLTTADACTYYGDLRCNPSNPKEVQRCEFPSSNDPNKYWTKYQTCSSTQTCSNGACVSGGGSTGSTCTHECTTAGQTQCTGTNTWRSCYTDYSQYSGGCRKWQNLNCQTGQTCNSNTGKCEASTGGTTCTHECTTAGQTQCTGTNTWRSCYTDYSQYSGGCRKWQN
ncbi:MAG: hypothetical protein HYX24_04915, partial [Candidatus Aenigmarchaeota archaeon]|nr:hypothetical protein [Candidatus Aenigmarchaeota archaeon]